jgi:hypothetical protein
MRSAFAVPSFQELKTGFPMIEIEAIAVLDARKQG